MGTEKKFLGLIKGHGLGGAKALAEFRDSAPLGSSRRLHSLEAEEKMCITSTYNSNCRPLFESQVTIHMEK